MAKVTAVDREKRRDEKYGISATISVGPLFSYDIAIGTFGLPPRLPRLEVIRHIEAAGAMAGDHKKLPNLATVIVAERDDLLDRSSDGSPLAPGRYRIFAGKMHVELWVLPHDLTAIASAIGRADLEIHMVIDPPAKGLRQVRSSFFKLGPIEHDPCRPCSRMGSDSDVGEGNARERNCQRPPASHQTGDGDRRP